MESDRLLMAHMLSGNSLVTIGERDIWGVAGDVVVDHPGGRRELMHKIDYDSLMECGNYAVSGDVQAGWVTCRKS